MLIYGNRATKTGHQSLFGVKCPNCQTRDSLEMYSFSRYVHLFWIPLFPYKKEAVTQCNHCKQVLHKKEFSSELQSKFEEMKGSIKTPYWQFAGLLLIGVLVAVGINDAAEDNKKDKDYLTSPKTGDIYQIRTEDGNYTLYKVAEVKNDSVYVMVNQYQTNKITGLTKKEITAPTSYSEDELLPLSKTELLQMKEKRKILGVKRF